MFVRKHLYGLGFKQWLQVGRSTVSGTSKRNIYPVAIVRFFCCRCHFRAPLCHRCTRTLNAADSIENSLVHRRMITRWSCPFWNAAMPRWRTCSYCIEDLLVIWSSCSAKLCLLKSCLVIRQSFRYNFPLPRFDSSTLFPSCFNFKSHSAIINRFTSVLLRNCCIRLAAHV